MEFYNANKIDMAGYKMEEKVKISIERYKKYRTLIPMPDDELQKYGTRIQKRNVLNKNYKEILFEEPGMEKWRNRIVKILFSDSIPTDIPAGFSKKGIYGDISEGKDYSVIGWLEKVNRRGAAAGTDRKNTAEYILHIDGDGKIYAPMDCTELFSGFSQVREIQFGKSGNVLDTSGTINMSSLFFKCSSLQELDISGFDTRNVKDMYGMFSDCCSLKRLNLKGLDTQNVMSMNSMFWQCKQLETLDVSGFDTKNVMDMYGMFFHCSSLQELDVRNFNTQNVINMDSMFSFCSSLKKLDLSEFDTRNVTDMSFMFYLCSGMRKLNIDSFKMENVTNISCMFSGCGDTVSAGQKLFEEKRYAEAVPLLEKNANSGHAESQYLLGLCYQKGLGVEATAENAENAEKAGEAEKAKNTENALKWFKAAAGQGHKKAQILVNEYYKKEAERREAKRRDAERREAEKREAERKEAERREAERREAERREAERKEAEKREAERKEAERKEAKRREDERREAEQKEAQRREQEKQESEKNASKAKKTTYIGISLQADKAVAAVCAGEKPVIITEIPCSEPEFMRKIDQGMNPAAEMAIMFHRVRMKAEEYLKCSVNGAMIAVPASFDVIQRQWVKDAACAAGWKYIRFLENVTAAGLCNEQKQLTNGDKAMLCSYEDGFVNVSVLDIGDGIVEVISADGSRCLDQRASEERVVEVILKVMKRAMKDAGMDWPELDKVVFVGNLTCMSALVYQMESVHTGLKFQYIQLKNVAMGAAMQAGKLNGNRFMQNILLLNTISQSIFISTREGMGLMIDKDTAIPAKYTVTVKTTVDYQTEADIGIFQCRKDDLDNKQKLGVFRLKGITPAPHGKARIIVTVELNTDGTIGLQAREDDGKACLEIADIMQPHHSRVNNIQKCIATVISDDIK